MKILHIIFACILSMQLLGQIMPISNLEHNKLRYDVFTIQVDSFTLPSFSIVENNGLLPHNEYIKNIPQDSPVFMINSGIVDSTCRPIGWYVLEGIELQPINYEDGYGNFYLKPNGALVLTSIDAYVLPTDELAAMGDVQLAVQSGPMLVSNGQINPNINASSQNRYIRCGVGVTEIQGFKELVFAISLQPVTFYEFTRFFQDSFQCKNALCLETAGSVFKFPFLQNPTDHVDFKVCNYLVYRL